MNENDGRVVSNFIVQALSGKNLTIYGDGSQTRSFQYVDDLINGLIALMESDCSTPVNLGNPEEITIKEFAMRIKGNEMILNQAQINSSVGIDYLPKVTDDPQQRKPDISKAKEMLDWEPKTSVDEGLSSTIRYFKGEAFHFS